MVALWAKTAAPADGLVHDSRPRRGVPKPNSTKQEGHMAQDDDDTVYCHIQMPLLHGKELLQLVAELRKSGTHPNLEGVFADIQYELTNSIDFVENPPASGDWFPTRH